MIRIAFALTIVLTIPLTATAQHDQHGAAGEKLGTAHFETSCSPATAHLMDIAKDADTQRAGLQSAKAYLKR